MTQLTVSQKKIFIVGEAYGEQEAREGRPFVGPSGQVLYGMLRAAGIDPRDCYFTNVFNLQPSDNKLEALSGPKTEAIEGWPQAGSKLFIHRRYTPELQRLWAEIEAHQPNVIIALGSTALWAICKFTGIKKFRGTPISSFDQRFKVLPTYHPAAIMRQWKLRPIAIADLAKAKRESLFPEIVRPERFIHIPESIEDLHNFYIEHILPAPSVSCDIETKQLQITEVGFSPDPSLALVIPFYSRERINFWSTLEEELEAWRMVRLIIETKPLIGQNFSYDLKYFWMKMGLRCMTVEDDTMILHHSMYPEMEKGLGFLGSIYTDEPSWKFMRADQETLKKED